MPRQLRSLLRKYATIDPGSARTSRPSWDRRLGWILAAVTVVTVVWAIEIVNILQLNMVTIRGTISVTEDAKSSTPCAFPGFKDLHKGTVITVSDPSHKTVALGYLRTGQPARRGLSCVYLFTIRTAPPGLKEYGIEVGDHGIFYVRPEQIAKVAITLH